MVLVGFGCVDGQLQFVFGGVQVLFGLRAMAFHIIVVGSAGAVHFVDRFQYMLVNFVEIVPIMNLLGEQRACDK
jgi:hypothetical protein